MICYPGKEFVEKQDKCNPYLYFSADDEFHLRDDAPEDVREAYEWCQEFVKNHPYYFD